MRRIFIGIAALALSGCGQPQNALQSACARSATHEAAWTNAEAPDTIIARADGPSCLQAVVTLTIRNAQGDPLWTVASTYYQMTAGGAAPADAAPVSAESMDAFLEGWAEVTLSTSGSLPAWLENQTLTQSATTFSYVTPLDRDGYEMLRERNLAMLCYASAVATTQCLVIDPLTNAPIPIVAYGP